MTDPDRLVDETMQHLRSMETFGAVGSALTMLDLRRADIRAADNLLGKARRVWHSDRERGLAYIGRAARLQFDEVEEVFPAALAAHTMLFSDVSEALEDSEPTDSGWLDAALSVLEAAAPDAQAIFRSVLAPVDQDGTMESAERRRLRRALSGGPVDQGPHEVESDTLGDYVTVVVSLCVAYAEALEAA